MTARTDRIVAALDALNVQETAEVAEAALNCLSLETRIAVVLAAFDATDREELAAHLDGEAGA